jgi:hypothetical protein
MGTPRAARAPLPIESTATARHEPVIDCGGLECWDAPVKSGDDVLQRPGPPGYRAEMGRYGPGATPTTRSSR